MSFRGVIYLGAFMRVPGILKEVQEGTYRCSAKCGGKVSKRDNFCSNCGAAVMSPTTVQKLDLFASNDLYELSAKYEDLFIIPEYFAGASEFEAVLIPNQRGFGINITDEDYMSISLVQSQANTEISKFKKKYDRVIAAIEAAHQIQVVVDYGIVSYSY